jgi:rhodanese-related sulfurtransferase/DNA-binding transcriptional ArsR family regulator
MTNITPRKRLFEHFSRVAKAMGSPNRLELLETLGQGERSVDELAKSSGMSVANTSHHLQVLRVSGLARSRKEGLRVFYRLADDAVTDLLVGIRGVAETQLVEVERIVRESFNNRDKLKPVKLLELLKRGDVLLLDVRPESEYAAGHIAGAISMPVDDLLKRLKGLPRDREIIAYCRGPYCMMAFYAVEQLRKRGLQARRLQDGYPEWKAEQHAVAMAA